MEFCLHSCWNRKDGFTIKITTGINRNTVKEVGINLLNKALLLHSHCSFQHHILVRYLLLSLPQRTGFVFYKNISGVKKIHSLHCKHKFLRLVGKQEPTGL